MLARDRIAMTFGGDGGHPFNDFALAKPDLTTRDLVALHIRCGDSVDGLRIEYDGADNEVQTSESNADPVLDQVEVDPYFPVPDNYRVFAEKGCVWDVMLSKLSNSMNQFYLIQLLVRKAKSTEDVDDNDDNVFDYHDFALWTRFGTVGQQGQNKLSRDLLLEDAKKIFSKTFKSKTNNDWANRESFVPILGCHVMLSAARPVKLINRQPPHHGGSGGGLHTFKLNTGECITGFDMTINQWLNSIVFITNTDRKSPMYGRPSGTEYHSRAPPGHGLSYLSGREGQLIDQLQPHWKLFDMHATLTVEKKIEIKDV